MVPVLELKNVTKIYGNRAVVNRVSFNVVRGEILGFVGPNGAGKSTTLKMICGLAKLDSGKIFINGNSIEKDFERAMGKVGAFIETPQMYDYLSGYDNLKILASLYGPEAVKRIPQAVRLVGLENRIKDKFSTYSLGMKQRLGIAQALLNKPDLLIFDEPTNGLDPNGIIEIRNIFRDLAKHYGISIIISSHNLAELQQICDTVAFINRGRIIDYKSMEEITSDVQKGQRVMFKVDYPHYAGSLLEKHLFVEAQVVGSCVLVNLAESKIAETIAFLVQHNLTIFGVEKIQKTLEELFLEIIKKDSNSTSIF